MGPTSVVVTGLGPLCAAGAGRDAVRRSLEEGRTPVREYDPSQDGIPAAPFPLYLVDDEIRDACLKPADRDAAGDDPELCLSLGSMRLAITDAGLEDEPLERAGLVLTWEAPGLDRLQRGLVEERFATKPGAKAKPDAATNDASSEFRSFYERHRQSFYGTHSFVHLHLAARALGLHGPTLFINNACASGLYAIEAGAKFLRDGHAEFVLVSAAECPRFPTKMMWFDELGLYANDGVVRPFDQNPGGIVFGEAGAAVVLETVEHANARGARIYAEYLGAAANQEAWKITVPDLSRAFYETCLRDACRSAGISVEDIDVLNVHGAATGLSDLYEARGITNVWGDWPTTPRIVALKPFFGHTLGACALLETCAMLDGLERQWLPATPGFQTRNERLKVAPSTEEGSASFKTVLKMSNGFAGFNAGAIFRSFDDSATTETR